MKDLTIENYNDGNLTNLNHNISDTKFNDTEIKMIIDDNDINNIDHDVNNDTITEIPDNFNTELKEHMKDLD